MSQQTIELRTLVNERPRDWRRGGASPVLNPGLPWTIKFDLLAAHRAIKAHRLDSLPRSHLVWDIDRQFLSPSDPFAYSGFLRIIETGDTPPPLTPPGIQDAGYTKYREYEGTKDEEQNVFLRKEFEAFERVSQSLSSARLTLRQGGFVDSTAPVLLQKSVSAADLSALSYLVKYSAPTVHYEMPEIMQSIRWDSATSQFVTANYDPRTFDYDFFNVFLNQNIDTVYGEADVRQTNKTRIKDVPYSAEKVVPYRDPEGQISGETADAYTSQFTFNVTASEANIRRGTHYMTIEVSSTAAPTDYYPVSGGPVLIEEIAPTAAPTGPSAGDDTYTPTALIADWP